MRILWIANSMMTEIAKESNRKAGFGGGWIPSMSERIRNLPDVELAITVFGNVRKLCIVEKENIVYYIFPIFKGLYKNGGGDKAFRTWRVIIDSFHPDVIHIYGTEQPTTIELVRNFKDIPIVVSLQGILSEYYKHYYGDMEFKDIIYNTTIADVIFGSSGYFGRKKFGKNIRYEKEILNNVKYVEGRTTWDRCVALSLNDKLKYYKCSRMLRSQFYKSEKWKLDEIIPHTIFIHQGNYAIKGLHFILPAIAMLKKKYPDIKLEIAGQDPTKRKGIKGKLSINGYSKYIKKLADKLGVQDSIKYVGSMGPEQIIDKLKKTNVMVIPSAIENSPNSLAEAMIIGTPCIASDVGGNSEMLDYGACGIVYPYNDSVMLANSIDTIFSNPQLNQEYSNRSIKRAEENHEPNKLEHDLLDIYSDIIDEHRRESI